MADLLFPIALLYSLAILYAEKRTLWKFSLVTQFITAFAILELAWLHGIICTISLIMAVGDLDDWSFTTLIGFPLTAYNIFLLWEIHQHAHEAEQSFEKTLTIGLGENYQQQMQAPRAALIDNGKKHQWLKPFSFPTDDMKIHIDLKYGTLERNTLSVFTPKEHSPTLRPVMLQIHGGGWVISQSQYQGLPLRNKLVEAGWVFVSINYRLSPQHKFPDHLVDCKKALCWIKENIEQYGGDPNFVMVTGGSAGGHLSSLLALTANKSCELLQPGFESADTSVQGAIPMYGVYDFTDRHKLRPDIPLTGFLEDYIMPNKQADDEELWELASPIAQAHDQRPPFMVVHGELDTLSFVEDARYFVKALRETSASPCVYTELTQTQHAFDIYYSPRCLSSIKAMHTFAEHTYSQYLAGDYISAEQASA